MAANLILSACPARAWSVVCSGLLVSPLPYDLSHLGCDAGSGETLENVVPISASTKTERFRCRRRARKAVFHLLRIDAGGASRAQRQRPRPRQTSMLRPANHTRLGDDHRRHKNPATAKRARTAVARQLLAVGQDLLPGKSSLGGCL